MCCEELVNCSLHFFNTRASAGDIQKVFCPEATCIFQSISNVVLLVSREIFNLTENSMATQVADIPLQPFSHQVEA